MSLSIFDCILMSDSRGTNSCYSVVFEIKGFQAFIIYRIFPSSTIFVIAADSVYSYGAV